MTVFAHVTLPQFCLPATQAGSLGLWSISSQALTITLGVGLLFAVLLLLLVVQALRCPAGWKAWFLYYVARIYCRLLFRWKALNTCTYPEHGAAIIVSNHTTPVDPVLLWVRHFQHFRKPRIRVIGYMMAREYFEMRGIVGWVFRAMESIPLSRSGQDTGGVRAALARLHDGKLLGVFPEGRINFKTPDTQLLKAGTGAAWLALKSGAPVIPVFIRNAPRGRNMVTSFLTPSRTRLIYGKPVDLSRWQDQEINQDVLAEVTDEIMRQLANLGDIDFTPARKAADAAAD